MKRILKHLKISKQLAPINPIIITDIDGVLLRGKTPIPNTLEALRKIKKNQIPLACLTNGGGRLQSQKANKMNDIFGQEHFKADLLFMNHTALKPYIKNESEKKGILLISGSCEVTKIIDDMGISNYVTADQLYTLYLADTDVSEFMDGMHFTINSLSVEQVQRNIYKRGLEQFNGFNQWAKQINSIFCLNDISPYETTLEVIHNIVEYRQSMRLSKINYYAAQNDIIWAGGYHRPRIAFGPFNFILKDHCSRFNLKLQQIYFGKPELKVFQFVESQMIKKFGQGYTFFMIGDNPQADIKGANSIGWTSFLTRTGIHQKETNDQQNPATIVVSDFAEAIDIIIQLKLHNYQ